MPEAVFELYRSQRKRASFKTTVAGADVQCVSLLVMPNFVHPKEIGSLVCGVL